MVPFSMTLTDPWLGWESTDFGAI